MPASYLGVGADEVRRAVGDEVRVRFQAADVFGLEDGGLHVVREFLVAVLGDAPVAVRVLVPEEALFVAGLPLLSGRPPTSRTRGRGV